MRSVRSTGPTGPEELTFPQEMFIRGMHMESAFDPKVVSPRGAQGIAQIMPNTVTEFRRLGIIGENEPFDPFDVNDARKGQEAYMNHLITRNEGTDQVRLAKAVAAYNYGQKNLNRYLAKQVKKGVDTMNTLDWVDELPGETKDYVKALMFAEFPKDKRDYEKQRHRYFETYPDVQDERQATTREDVAPMESKDPSPQISPELQEALDILIRDQKNYEHGGVHDEGPTGARRPAYRDDTYNAPKDTVVKFTPSLQSKVTVDEEMLDKEARVARAVGIGAETRGRDQKEGESDFAYGVGTRTYTIVDPSETITANEYYRDAFNDPSVVELINQYFSEGDAIGNYFAAKDLRELYPNADDATIGELYARRNRDIMSAVTDGNFGMDEPLTLGSAMAVKSDAGSKKNPIWMGLGDVQRRGIRSMQVDQDDATSQYVTTHEMSHALDRAGDIIPYAMKQYMEDRALSYADTNQEDGYTKKRHEYVTDPSETRARLNDLRQRVYELRGDKFDRNIDAETLSKLEGAKALEELRRAYGTDEVVLDLLNNVYEHGGKHDEDKEPKRKVKDITDPKYRVISQKEADAYDRYGEEMKVLNDLVNTYRATHPIGNFIFEQARNAMAPYIMENVRPIEYPTIREMGNALQHMIDGTRAAPQRDPEGNYVAAEEAFARSLGLNPEERYFTRSDYRPSTSQDPDAKYYRYEGMDPYFLLEQALRQGLLDETVGDQGQYKTSVILGGSDRVNNLDIDRRGVDPLQRFKVSIGQDEKGPYLSYYDKYDLHGIANQILAEPMEVYDRFYLDNPEFAGLGERYRRSIMRALENPSNKTTVPKSETPGHYAM